MKNFKVVTLVLVLLLILGSVGYGAKKTAIGDLCAIMDGATVILKKHAKNPEAAAKALTRYLKINQSKMLRINKVIAKQSEAMKKDPTKINSFMTQFAPLIQKSMEMQQLSMQLMKNKKLMKAMMNFKKKTSVR